MSDNPFIVPPQGYYFCTGCSTTIQWKPTTAGTVTISMHDMSAGSDPTIAVVAMSIPNNGSFTYTPPNTIPSGTQYMLEIVDDNDHSKVSFSPEFALENLAAASSSSMIVTTESMNSSMSMTAGMTDSLSSSMSMTAGMTESLNSSMTASNGTSINSMSTSMSMTASNGTGMSSMPTSTFITVTTSSTISSISSSPTVPYSSKQLSTGADVGIAVGSAAFILILVVLAYLVGRRSLARKRRFHQQGTDMVGSLGFQVGIKPDSEPEFSPMTPSPPPTELEAKSPLRLSSIGVSRTITSVSDRSSEVPSPPPDMNRMPPIWS